MGERVESDPESTDSAPKPPGDWAWRARLRANPRTRPLYRVGVGVVGTGLALAGLALIPLPGPGWVVVFLGLGVLGSEFTWAARLLGFARRQVSRWTSWAGRRSLVVRLLLALLTAAALVGAVWLTLRLSGVPGFVPKSWTSWAPTWTGLRR